MEKRKKYKKENGENMEIIAKIGISNHHVHVTKETYEQLFDEPLTVSHKLNQMGEFASNQFVTLKTEKNTIENVRVVGPFRSYNQIEVSKSDAYFLGINPPVRMSGDIKNSEAITIIGPKQEIHLDNGCILAKCHVHLNPEDARKLQVQNGQEVKIKVPGSRSATISALTKVSENGYFEVHIDRDEANALLLKNQDEVTIEL